MAKALEGRIALVTGASRGIGVGIARCMAEEGARVVVAARNEEGLQETCRQIEATGAEALAVPADVGVEDQVIAMIGRVEEAWGSVELLVNNAGVHGDEGWSDHFPERTRDWETAYRVNMLSRVWACDRVLPSMRKRSWGRIVNISSIAGLEGFPAHLAYNGSRAAEINYTQALAREVGPFGVTVNAILPGLVYTDMAESLWKHVGHRFGAEMAGDDPKVFFDRTVESMTPLRRPQEPEDIGWMAVYLCSDRGRNITGQAINVDGGMRMH